MLTTDVDTARVCVDVERSSARKVLYNARSVVGLRCNLSLRHYYKTHYLPDRKSRGKLKEKGVRIPGTGSVFHNSRNTGSKNLRYARRCVQHRVSKSWILLKVEAKLVYADQTATEYRGTLDGEICIAKQQRGAGGEVATPSVPRHNVETPTTGHHRKAH